MTQTELLEWRDTIVRELTAAGFEVKDHQGWPLVEVPSEMRPMQKLLRLRLSVAAVKAVYAEGMVFTPPGLELENKPIMRYGGTG